MTEVNGAKRPQAGSNFSAAFLLLPKPKREALEAVYGFCRYVDDIVDSGEHSREKAAELLGFWRAEIERLYAGQPTHEMARALEPHVRRYHLPKEGFLELLSGVGMDLENTRYETFADLERYLFGVAGTVGLLCIEIFGYKRTPPEDARRYAITMGNAFQLTNILRDVGTDLERGRIYLPLEDIRSSGYSAEAFLRREHSPQFMKLMGMEHARAKEFYARARNLLHASDRPAMAPAEAMARIYEAILDEIKERQFRVFFHRVSLPRARKAALVLRAWLYSYGIY